MDVPTLVADALGDEEVVAHLSLKGEDALYVTRSGTLRYTSEGLISDESVMNYPHDAERVGVETGRRKAKIVLDYGTGGQKSFSVPSSKLDEALHPVLAGVLHAAGVTEPGETVKETFRFSELTLVVTSERLIKHVGSAVWDSEYEEVPYERVTGIDVEEGNVSSQLVISTPDRIQRIKAPNESYRLVEESVQESLLEYYGVDSLAELDNVLAEPEEADTESGAEAVSFDTGVDPIQPGSTETAEDGSEQTASVAEAVEKLEENGFTSAAAKVKQPIDPDELQAELDELEGALEKQAEALEEQRRRLEALRELVPDR